MGMSVFVVNGRKRKARGVTGIGDRKVPRETTVDVHFDDGASDGKRIANQSAGVASRSSPRLC